MLKCMAIFDLTKGAAPQLRKRPLTTSGQPNAAVQHAWCHCDVQLTSNKFITTARVREI
jgi:hypothetical protein